MKGKISMSEFKIEIIRANKNDSTAAIAYVDKKRVGEITECDNRNFKFKYDFDIPWCSGGGHSKTVEEAESKLEEFIRRWLYGFPPAEWDVGRHEWDTGRRISEVTPEECEKFYNDVVVPGRLPLDPKTTVRFKRATWGNS